MGVSPGGPAPPPAPADTEVPAMLPPLANDPLRPADWRWRRARYLAEGGRPLPRHDDPRTRSLTRHLRALGRCRTDHSRARLAARCPDLAAALAVYRGGPSLARSALEAWVLTGLPPGAVAIETGLSAGAVGAYEECF